MNANPILLQKKYCRIVEAFALKEKMMLGEALDFFYKSQTYQLISNGISDMHCRSDEYLVEELQIEYKSLK